MIFEVMLRGFIGGLVKPKPTPFDAKDELIKHLTEERECVHMYLDDIEVPRIDDKGEPYSIVGRIKELELKQTKALSELESTYMGVDYQNMVLGEEIDRVRKLEKEYGPLANQIVHLTDENDRIMKYLDRLKAPIHEGIYVLSIQGRFSALLEEYQNKIDELTDKPKEDDKPVEYMVGTLNKPWGLIGFNRAEKGHFVYEKHGRYVIYLSNDKVPKHEVGFFKKTLEPIIDFFVLQ